MIPLVILGIAALVLAGCGTDSNTEEGKPVDGNDGKDDVHSDTADGQKNINETGVNGDVRDQYIGPNDTSPDQAKMDINPSPPSDAGKSPKCGNSIRDDSEICDGLDLADETCITQDFDGGVLACKPDCMDFDRSNCTRDGHLEVHYIDVGQGDSTFVLSPTGKTLLIDAGDSYHGDVVANYLSKHMIGYLDYLMASHYHEDHIGGSIYVLYNIPVGTVYDRGGSYDSEIFQEDYITAAGDKRTTLQVGDTIDLGDSLDVEVLQLDYSSDENDKSIVLKLIYSGHTFLFGGDCTSNCEASFNPGDIDVYKVHHHGSYDASSQSFLDVTTPEVSVISAGVDNLYGHPHQEALDRLFGIGSDIYRTDLHGNVLIKCDEMTCWANKEPEI